MFSYWAKPEDALDVSRIVNDDLAATVRQNPKRFVGLANLPMHAPELAVEEMKRATIDLKMSGFQIGSHVGDWNLLHTDQVAHCNRVQFDQLCRETIHRREQNICATLEIVLKFHPSTMIQWPLLFRLACLEN